MSVDIQHVSVDIHHVSVDIHHVSVDIQHVVTFEPIFLRDTWFYLNINESEICVFLSQNISMLTGSQNYNSE